MSLDRPRLGLGLGMGMGLGLGLGRHRRSSEAHGSSRSGSSRSGSFSSGSSRSGSGAGNGGGQHATWQRVRLIALRRDGGLRKGPGLMGDPSMHPSLEAVRSAGIDHPTCISAPFFQPLLSRSSPPARAPL